VQLTVDPEVKQAFRTDADLFDQIMALQGQVYRELEGRRTQRIELQGRGYFLKQHYGIGWREVLKNLLQLRLPVYSAKNEWQALQRLQALAIPTLEPVAFGQRGCNPARMESFLVTRELTGVISLEDLCRDWPSAPPAPRFKWALIVEIARMMRIMHTQGINHRDCYICHFMLDQRTVGSSTPRLHVIDLHRAQLRAVPPRRWVIKDLAGLYFSSKDSGLTSRDLLRFIREYRKQALQTVLANEGTFWKKVEQRGNRTYRKHGQS
jgi:heptose I phosphotransferase